jgi:hypothetical protein
MRICDWRHKEIAFEGSKCPVCEEREEHEKKVDELRREIEILQLKKGEE